MQPPSHRPAVPEGCSGGANTARACGAKNSLSCEGEGAAALRAVSVQVPCHELHEELLRAAAAGVDGALAVSHNLEEDCHRRGGVLHTQTRSPHMTHVMHPPSCRSLLQADVDMCSVNNTITLVHGHPSQRQARSIHMRSAPSHAPRTVKICRKSASPGTIVSCSIAHAVQRDKCTHQAGHLPGVGAANAGVRVCHAGGLLLDGRGRPHEAAHLDITRRDHLRSHKALVNRSISQSIDGLINRSIHQPISQSTNQRINQSII